MPVYTLPGGCCLVGCFDHFHTTSNILLSGHIAHFNELITRSGTATGSESHPHKRLTHAILSLKGTEGLFSLDRRDAAVVVRE